MAEDAQRVAEASWGVVDPHELRRVCVVSPHFDDAVLGAAHVITRYPGSTVITVFGGCPPSYADEPSDWDACGGFGPGEDVVAARREEDRAAMEFLGAAGVWLDFADHQYLDTAARPQAADVAPALERAIADNSPSAVFLPMGLANPDHVVTHDAGLLARAASEESTRAPSWFCYEDGGYKHIPGLLAWRITKLFRSGLWPTPAMVPIEPDMARKRAAIERYKSQVPPLERDHALRERLDANVPEQYWRLAPPPSGWELLMDLA